MDTSQKMIIVLSPLSPNWSQVGWLGSRKLHRSSSGVGDTTPESTTYPEKEMMKKESRLENANHRRTFRTFKAISEFCWRSFHSAQQAFVAYVRKSSSSGGGTFTLIRERILAHDWKHQLKENNWKHHLKENNFDMVKKPFALCDNQLR